MDHFFHSENLKKSKLFLQGFLKYSYAVFSIIILAPASCDPGPVGWNSNPGWSVTALQYCGVQGPQLEDLVLNYAERCLPLSASFFQIKLFSSVNMV